MTTLLERANAISNPHTRRDMVAAVKECYEAMLEAIEIPNSMLADEYQNKTQKNSDGESEMFQPLSVIIERLEREEAANVVTVSEHEQLKAITTARVNIYAEEFDKTGSFEFDVDEDRLYRRQVEFAKYAGLLND